MKNHRIPKSSFLYRFSLRFVLLILLPVLAGWLIFTAAIHYFYADSMLESRQISLEKSLSHLDTSLNAISNVGTALKGNTEFVYYLDFYTEKPDMLYALEKNIRSFCDSLSSMNTYLSGITIYSGKKELLYAPPFARLSEIPLSGEELSALCGADPTDRIWHVEQEEGQEFPSLYCYQKFYAYNYAKVIGYIEIRLSPDIFADYFELLGNLTDHRSADITLYYGDTPVYSTGGNVSGLPAADAPSDGYRMDYLRQTYTHTLRIEEPQFSLLLSGKLGGLNASAGKLLTPIVTVVLLLLLGLFLIFFSTVASLSKRILDFSSFIRNSDRNALSPYPAEPAAGPPDELTLLIDSYNGTIAENTALISRVQKMELLSQNARYQALQGQIHPHFIYGTLEAIRMTALQNKDRDAASMIYSLSDLIRYSVSISSEPVTLKEELAIASHYLKIQKIRFDERLDYRFSADETLLNFKLPSFVFQPLLENAILYGVSQSLAPFRLLVEARREGGDIVLRVQNSGITITAERLAQVNALLSGTLAPEDFPGSRNGKALSNIRERFLIYFRGNADFSMTCEDGCTATVIRIHDSLQEGDT